MSRATGSLGNVNFGDGKGALINLSNRDYISNEMISIELLTLIRLNLYSKFLDSHSYMHCITHPKMISMHNLWCLDYFLKHVKEKYSINTDFRTFTFK